MHCRNAYSMQIQQCCELVELAAPGNSKSQANTCKIQVNISQEKKHKVTSLSPSLSGAFSFPMVASCCLLLSLHYHCLDSLKLLQEGKVDIYVEAFRLTICKSALAFALAAWHWYKLLVKAVGVKRTGSYQCLAWNRWGLQCLFSHWHCQFEPTSSPLIHSFHRDVLNATKPAIILM